MIASGGASLLLAAVGIYGVVAFGLRQRTPRVRYPHRDRRDAPEVTRLVVGQGTSMAIVSLAIGIVLVTAAGVMQGFVYGVAPEGRVKYGRRVGLLILMVVGASYTTARLVRRWTRL